MTDLEETYQRICDDNIFVDEFEFEKLQGLVVMNDDEFHIAINKNLEENEKKYVAEHEYSHILTNTLYYIETSKMTKLRRETKANDNMIQRLGLVNKVLPLIEEKLKPFEICEILNIPNYIFWLCVNYMKRKSIL